jgi:hypothetical protein
MKLLYGNKAKLSEQDIIFLRDLKDTSMMVSSISNRLAHQYKLIMMGILEPPIKITILVEERFIGKFKPEDKETNLDRIIFLCNEFEQPVDIEYSIYSVDRFKVRDEIFRSHDCHNALWSFKRKHIGNKKTIMMKTPSSQGYQPYGYKTRGINLRNVELYAKVNGLDIIEYNYSHRFDDILNNMIQSQRVYSERTGLSLLAVFSHTPLYLVTEKKMVMELEGVERPLTWGSGNLTLNQACDQMINGVYTQKRKDDNIWCITPEEI